MSKKSGLILRKRTLSFSTITQLVDTACEDLKRKLAQEKRMKWRQEAHKEYAKSDQKYVWESIDGEEHVHF